VLLDFHRRLFYLGGIAITVVQFPLWILISSPTVSAVLSGQMMLDVVDKLAQLALIAVLAQLYRQS
jgi:hypothetical protein